jgi:hypothetical protein
MATTAPITRALRNAGLPEAKVVERHANGKARTWQQGWTLDKADGYVVVRHSALNWQTAPEFTHELRTTDNYAEFAAWLETVTAVLTAAGLTVETVPGEHKFGTFKEHRATVVREIRVTK